MIEKLHEKEQKKKASKFPKTLPTIEENLPVEDQNNFEDPGFKKKLKKPKSNKKKASLGN